MDTHSRIDITFDFRSDTPGYPKKDPDALSPTLRRYHKLLWSKPLPRVWCSSSGTRCPGFTCITFSTGRVLVGGAMR